MAPAVFAAGVEMNYAYNGAIPLDGHFMQRRDKGVSLFRVVHVRNQVRDAVNQDGVNPTMLLGSRFRRLLDAFPGAFAAQTGEAIRMEPGRRLLKADTLHRT